MSIPVALSGQLPFPNAPRKIRYTQTPEKKREKSFVASGTGATTAPVLSASPPLKKGCNGAPVLKKKGCPIKLLNMSKKPSRANAWLPIPIFIPTPSPCSRSPGCRMASRSISGRCKMPSVSCPSRRNSRLATCLPVFLDECKVKNTFYRVILCPFMTGASRDCPHVLP